MTQILDVHEPVWIPESREWELGYVVADTFDGKDVKYKQRIWCEALVSAERITKEIKKRIK